MRWDTVMFSSKPLKSLSGVDALEMVLTANKNMKESFSLIVCLLVSVCLSLPVSGFSSRLSVLCPSSSLRFITFYFIPSLLSGSSSLLHGGLSLLVVTTLFFFSVSLQLLVTEKLLHWLYSQKVLWPPVATVDRWGDGDVFHEQLVWIRPSESFTFVNLYYKSLHHLSCILLCNFEMKSSSFTSAHAARLGNVCFDF